MKRFPMINALLQLAIALTVGLLEKIFIFIYCCMPIGLFMLLMSLRSKNHSASAIGTFTSERSEFQHIFPNYILVIVEPMLLKKWYERKIKGMNTFLDKYKIMITILFYLVVVCLLGVSGYLIYKRLI